MTTAPVFTSDDVRRARRLAARVAANVPAHVDRDDLAAVAVAAWWEALCSHDPQLCVPPAAHAATRTRYAVLDELRRGDRYSHETRARLRLLAAALRELPSPRTDRALARYLGWDETEVRRRRVELAGDLTDELTDVVQHTMDPADTVALRTALATLEGREAYVVTQRYFADTPTGVIADRLGVHISRVSQLQRSALARLRRELDADCDEPVAPPR